MNPALDVAIASAAPPGTAVMLDAATWRSLAAGDARLGFVGLFVSGGRVHALFTDGSAPLLLATELIANAYPSIATGFPQAAWFERLAFDQTGATAEGATDRRPAIAQGAAGTDAAWPRFIETAGEGFYQIGAGPVAGRIASPVHRRFSMGRFSMGRFSMGRFSMGCFSTDDTRILRLEHRLGYAHRGIAGLMRGKSPRVAARFAARIAGDATVAHAVAFARAAEAASGAVAPPRAVALRAIMVAVERMTADLAALAAAVAAAGDARFATLLGQAREQSAVALGEAFGHRLMMDIVVPGGLALDLRGDAVASLLAALDRASLVVRAFAWGRVRRDLGPAAGIAQARARSIRALAASVRADLAVVPEGIIAAALPAGTGTALGAAESARGMVYHWIDLLDGQIRDCVAIDPSARLLPALEAGVVGLDPQAAAVLIACYGLSVGAIDG
ncbi:nickel-dependent hydrogenase large subunit [Acidiphilium angustum]|uniref:nickel-dependent hydrogenase large subunit n=1 Tax=Acidiphilium angustum TaxID=523 RepID=UPI000691854E|nr:nickel-dependent hydrogenase large subunit [Acidiphilium angustum]